MCIDNDVNKSFNQEIIISIDIIEYHLAKYTEYKYISQYGKKASERKRAVDNMIISANYIESELCKSHIYPILNNQNPYAFENFWKYVESDVPGYLKKIRESITP